MSKIQITELNNTSEFNTLNAQETTDVVGGGYGYGYGKGYGKGYGYKYNNAWVNQQNYSKIQQVAFGGGFKSPATNNAYVNQNNNSYISQH